MCLCILIILFYAKALICNLLRMTVYPLLKESLYHGRLTENFRESFRYIRIFSCEYLCENENKFSRKCENENFRFNPTISSRN
jgi:hypothetical protein